MPAAKTTTKSTYDVHPSVAMVQKTIAGLKEKTGRSSKNGPSWCGKTVQNPRKIGVHGSKRGTAGNELRNVDRGCSVGTGEDGNPRPISTGRRVCGEDVRWPQRGFASLYDELLKLAEAWAKT